VFRMVLTINREYFPEQHQPVGLCSGYVNLFPARYGLNLYIIQEEISLYRINGTSRRVTTTAEPGRLWGWTYLSF
jgi:hypothetical protein